MGDFNLANVTSLADPCPLPSAAKKKGLRDKEKLFYAPMSGLGDLLYDKDAVYININDHFVQYSQVDDDKEVPSTKGNWLPLFYCLDSCHGKIEDLVNLKKHVENGE